MTGEIVIRMSNPPQVFVDGIEVGVQVSCDYHRTGTLDVENLTIRGIANGTIIARAKALATDHKDPSA